MRDHDDDLDLSAWEVPPPADGLADAVIARMGGTAVGLAMPAQDVEPGRRRWIVIAASAAAVLALTLGTWIIVRGREHAPATSGEVVATRAQHVDLGGVAAELDRGADVTWRRDGATVRIEQKAGTAQWRVAGDQQVVIGAAVASPISIDATGATLRVEVPMNMSDTRVIGASAITAAAVAMVTVVVYEGHVKVTSGGQTVVVQPGSTFTVPPPAPPQPPEPPVVGVAPVDPDHKQLVAVLGLEGTGDPVARDLTEGLRARAKAGTGPYQLAAGSDKQLVDEKILHNCADEAPSCMAMIGDELGADMLVFGHIDPVKPGVEVTLTLFDVHKKVVERSVTEVVPASEASGAALQGYAKKLYIKLTGGPSDTTTCNVKALEDQGVDAMGNGKHAAALALFEKALACKPGSDRVVKLAFMASCSAKTVDKARTYWRQLAPNEQATLLQMCLRSGITKDDLDGDPPACDAQALEDRGISAEAAGQHAVALSTFEQALTCKPGDGRLVKLAFMTSCSLKSLGKARTYWRQLAQNEQAMLLQICIRSGITKDDLDGGPREAKTGDDGVLNISCKPQAKIVIDNVDTGLTTPAHVRLRAGKHKLTFRVGDDRFTYAVTIKAGESTTISKDLQ